MPKKEIMEQFTRVSFYTIRYQDLNEIIHDELGCKDYDIARVDFWPNDSEHSICIGSTAFYEGYERTSVLKYLKGGGEDGVPSPEQILSELIVRDIIECGDYIITVCW